MVDGARPHDPSKPSVLIRLPRRTEMLVLPERSLEISGDARDLDVAMYRAKPPTEQDLFDVRNAAAPISPVNSFDSVLAQVDDSHQ